MMYHCSLTSFNIFKGTFEGKNSDWDPPFQRFLLRILSCLFELLPKCFQSCCENCILRFRKKNLTSFFAEFADFSPSLSKLISKFWPSSFTTVLKPFKRFGGTIGEKSFLYCFLSFFLFWVKSYCSFGKSTSAGLSKLNSTFPGETFTIYFWKTYNFAIFSDLKRKKYSNVSENDRHRIQATFDDSQETIWGKVLCVENFVGVTFLSDFGSFFALSTGKFGRFIRTVCLPVRCNLCRLHFKSSWFFKTFWNWAETLKVFGSKNSPVLSKNQSICSKEKRREKKFS